MKRAASPQELLDAGLRVVCDAARVLPSATADNAATERARCVRVLERGGVPVPKWSFARPRALRLAAATLDAARSLLAHVPGGPALYAPRLDELELDLALLDALGDARRVRPIAARRYGTGADHLALARRILEETPAPHDDPRIVAADEEAPGTPSLGDHIRALGAAVGIDVTVKVEPRLAAVAASGERTVWVSGRPVGRREAARLAVHEVLGHLVAAANARAQPLAILELGTAGAFEDQEGVAVWLEERAGLLDATRLRTLAARVVVTHAMHAGASFGETARRLVRDDQFAPADAITLVERAWRGGGLARDAGYLAGWLRVRAAIEAGRATVDELRFGRVSLAALPILRELRADGLVLPPRYRPGLGASLAMSRECTPGGTIFDTSPPSAAASFTSVDAT